MLYKKTVVETLGIENVWGGEGVGRVGRYLWSIPHSEKAKLKHPFQGGENGKKRKRKTKGECQDDHTEVC